MTTSTAPAASAAELAQEAILTADYVWGYSQAAKQLQDLLGLAADGNYGAATRIGHLAVLEQRGLTTRGVPAPPVTTTAAPTTTYYTHPGVPTNIRAGTPWLTGGSYSVVVAWDAPSESGSSAIKNYEISQAYYSDTKSWTTTGTTTQTTASSLAGSHQYSFEVRAVNNDGRKGSWSEMIYVRTPALPTTTTTVPVTTTTFQIVTTTESAVPHYKLAEYLGNNERWDPCGGPVSIKLNPMGHLTGPEIDDWATLLRELAAEISSFTGLNVVYGGQTGTDFRLSHPGGRTSVDILIGFAQHGAAHLGSYHSSENYWGNNQKYIDYNQTPGWWTMSAVDIQVATDSSYGSNLIAPKNFQTTYLMNNLGSAFGVDKLDDGIDTEIMSWGGRGSSINPGKPDWGEGDKIAFGLVGANNGCLY